MTSTIKKQSCAHTPVHEKTTNGFQPLAVFNMPPPALSAAVDTRSSISVRPPHRRNQARRNVPTRTPAALRERGVWGERRFSQRSGLSPQRPLPPRLLGREREGGDFSTEKSPPSRSLPKRREEERRFWGRGRFSKRSASPPDPLSRRVAGNRLVRSSRLVRPC